MAKRIRTLCRHASQQHRRKPRPRWFPDLDILEQSSSGRGAPSAQSSSTRPTRSSAVYVQEAQEIDVDNGNYLGCEQQMPPKKKDGRSLILYHVILYCVILCKAMTCYTTLLYAAGGSIATFLRSAVGCTAVRGREPIPGKLHIGYALYKQAASQLRDDFAMTLR